MPQAIDLVLRNGAAANKTFKVLAPAAGFGSAAEWALPEGDNPSSFPTLTAMVRKGTSPVTGKQSATKVTQLKLKVPFIADIAGVPSVVSGAEFNGTFTVPDTFPITARGDLLAYVADAVASLLVKDMVKNGASAS